MAADAGGVRRDDTGRKQASGAVTVYRPDSQNSVELRLHGVENAASVQQQSLDNWFNERIRTPPLGLELVKYGQARAFGGEVRVVGGVAGTASGETAAVAIGCARNDRSKRYAELLGPLDREVLARYVQGATELVAASCRESAATATVAKMPARVAATRGQNSGQAFKYLAPRGRGLPAAQIELVLYSWKQVYQVNGLQMLEDAYLVLKGGSVRAGLPPVPPAEFDFAAERAAEPQRWGRWRRQGDSIQVNLSGENIRVTVPRDQFVTPPHPSTIVDRPVPSAARTLAVAPHRVPASATTT